MGNQLLLALEAKLGEGRPTHWQSFDEYNFECPKCGNGKRKFGVNFVKKFFNCFRCHWSGRLNELVRELGITLDDMRDIVPGAPSRAADSVEAGPAVPEAIPGFTKLSDGQEGEVWADAVDYAAKRGGLTMDDVEELGLGVSEDPDLAGRLIIPIVQDGKTVNYLARSIYPWVQPKEIGGPGWAGWLPRSEIFFGHDQLKTNSHIILVEGFWDWWAMRRTSRSWSSVALLGSNLSQVVCGKLLASKPRRVTLFLDGDEGGSDGTFQAGMALLGRRYREVYVARPPAGKDPDELSDNQILLAVNNAVPMTAWLAAR